MWRSTSVWLVGYADLNVLTFLTPLQTRLDLAGTNVRPVLAPATIAKM